MKFEEVLPLLKSGRKIRRKDELWKKYYGSLFISETKDDILTESEIIDYYKITKEDLLTDDWEIVKEKHTVKLRDLIEEQLEKWQRKNCKGETCKDCVFNKADNCIYVAYCWAKDKSVYSDKFLDQEIEIEEE